MQLAADVECSQGHAFTGRPVRPFRRFDHGLGWEIPRAPATLTIHMLLL